MSSAMPVPASGRVAASGRRSVSPRPSRRRMPETRRTAASASPTATAASSPAQSRSVMRAIVCTPTIAATVASSGSQSRFAAITAVAASTITANAAAAGVMPVSIAWSAGASAEPTRPIPPGSASPTRARPLSSARRPRRPAGGRARRARGRSAPTRPRASRRPLPCRLPRPRALRGAGRTGTAAAAGQVRPAPRRARGRRNRSRGGVRDARGRVGALDLVPDALGLPLAGAIAALDRGHTRAGARRCSRHRASARAHAAAPGDRHGHDSRRSSLRSDRAPATAVIAAKRELGALPRPSPRSSARRRSLSSPMGDWAGDAAAVAVGLALAAVSLSPAFSSASAAARPTAPAGSDPAAGRDRERHCSRRPRSSRRVPIAVPCARRQRDVGRRRGSRPGRDGSVALVVGTSFLALVAVATASSSRTTLTLAWAAQAVLLSVLASRLRDARLQAGGLAIWRSRPATPSSWTRRRPSCSIPPRRRPRVDRAGGRRARGARCGSHRSGPARRRDRGHLSPFSRRPKRSSRRVAAALQEMLVFSAGVLGVLASAVFLTGIAFDAGHVAATAIAAAAGAAALAVAARRRWTGLIVASLVALLVVLGESIYDVGELAGDSDRSIGGLSMIFAAAGLLAGGFALRVLHPTPRRLGIVSGTAATVALGWSTFGVAFLVPENGDYEPSATWVGIGLLVVAVVYTALAGSVFVGRGSGTSRRPIGRWPRRAARSRGVPAAGRPCVRGRDGPDGSARRARRAPAARAEARPRGRDRHGPRHARDARVHHAARPLPRGDRRRRPTGSGCSSPASRGPLRWRSSASRPRARRCGGRGSS